MKNKSMKEILIESYIQIQYDLTNSSNINCEFSGTTCITTLIQKNKIFCANTGDSRALIVKYQNNVWNFLPLSNDHKPDKIVEKKRILQNKGEVDSYKGKKIL